MADLGTELPPGHRLVSLAEDPSLRISYDDIDLLKVLNMDPVPPDADEYMPEWLKDLDGTRIRIRGFMLPTAQSRGLKQFVLVRDNLECCFGPGAALFDWLVRGEAFIEHDQCADPSFGHARNGLEDRGFRADGVNSPALAIQQRANGGLRFRHGRHTPSSFGKEL